MRSSATTALSLILAMAVALPANAAPISWTAPVNVSSLPDADSPQIGAAADGTLTVVWPQSGASTTTIMASQSTDNGATWSTPMDVAGSTTIVYEPQIAVAADGSRTVVWVEDDAVSGTRVIHAATSPAGALSWSTPATLSDTAQNSDTPRISIDPTGTRYVLWSTDIGGQSIVTGAGSADGLTWDAPGAISDPSIDSAGGHSAFLPSGSIVALWVLPSTGGVQSAVSSDGGMTWSTPADLVSQGPDAEYSRLAIGPSGRILAIWDRNSGADYVVQSATSIDGLTWTAAVDLATGTNSSVAIAASGTIYATWIYTDPVTGDGTVQTSRSTDNGASWSTPLDLSVAGGTTGLEADIAVDAGAAVTVLWREDDNVNASAVVQSSTSTDGGATFEPTVAVSAVAQGVTGPRLAVSPTNAVIAVWAWYDGSTTIIQAARRVGTAGVSASGAELAATGSPAHGLPIGIVGLGLITAGILTYSKRPQRAAHRA